MKNESYLSKRDFLLPVMIFVIIWTFIFIYTDILNAGFNYILDDHQIVLNHEKYNRSQDIFIEPFSILFSSNSLERFRPLYDVFLRFFSQAYGLDSFAWYISSFFVAIITTSIFYFVGRLQKLSLIESIGFACLIVFGQQSSTYARFGTPETTSTLLLSFVFLLGSLNTTNKKLQIITDFLFITFAILSALNKEACILMLPALCFFKIWNLSRSKNISLRVAFQKNIFNTTFVCAIFLIFISYIKMNVHAPSYASPETTFSIPNFVNSVRANNRVSELTIIITIAYLTIYRRISNIISFYILIALIIIPQSIIYNKVGMFGHYLLPATIGISLLVFYQISQIRQQFTSVAKILTLLSFCVILIQIVFTVNYFENAVSNRKSLNSMIVDTSNCVGKSGVMIVVGSPYIHYEALGAFKIISEKVIHNNKTFIATIGSQKSDFLTDVYKEEEKPWYYVDPQISEKLYYNNQALHDMSQQDIANVKGVLVNYSRKIEKPLLELNLDWFNSKMVKKYYRGIDMSLYCR
jgi:hypothetical protein